ncbi:MAG: GNAT family N-acetyltransferase [Desulfococcaceae bacterium]
MTEEQIIHSKKGQYIIRPYQKEDAEEVISLWNLVFGKEMSRDIWNWKYTNNPYGYNILLCVSENKTVAVFYGGISYTANCMGQTVKIANLMDVMAHPEHRGWMFIKTVKAYYDTYGSPEKLTFLYGFPGEKHYIIGQKLLRYKKLEKGLTYLLANAADNATCGSHFGNYIRKTEKADGAFGLLWNKCADAYPFAVIRDDRFMQWRFFDHPVHRYEIWGYFSIFSKQLKGYAAVLHENEKIYLIDLFVIPCEKTAKDFLSQIICQLGKQGKKEIAAWLPTGHFLMNAAISSGFKTAKEPLGIIPVGMSFDPDVSLNWASENMFYTMADGDLY